MDDTIVSHKTAEPNVQLLFWDRNCSDLRQFFNPTNVLLFQSLISVCQIFLFSFLACTGSFPLFQWDCSPSTKSCNLQRKVRILLPLLSVCSKDRVQTQLSVDSWKRNLEVDILTKKYLPWFRFRLEYLDCTRSTNSMASFGGLYFF